MAYLLNRLYGSKTSSVEGDLSFRNTKSLGAVLSEEGCGGYSRVAKGQKARWGYKFTRFSRRHLEMAATLKYIAMFTFALLFVHSPLRLQTLSTYCVTVHAFYILHLN